MNYELDDLDLKNNSPSSIEKEIREVEEGIWEKLERVGKKINFARDVKALYKYMRDRYVPWYRKSIVVGALIYFISPIDTIPDLAPLVGYLDDLGVITAVLKFLGSELIPYYSN
jgi:uncharacterized membrane protein YkvA (DUF1232 family)